MLSVWDKMDDLFAKYDGYFKAEVASECAWSGELRLTLTDPSGEPSRSMTFFKAGEADPKSVALAVLKDAEDWMSKSGVSPMPVPMWMVDDQLV